MQCLEMVYGAKSNKKTGKAVKRSREVQSTQVANINTVSHDDKSPAKKHKSTITKKVAIAAQKKSMMQAEKASVTNKNNSQPRLSTGNRGRPEKSGAIQTRSKSASEETAYERLYRKVQENKNAREAKEIEKTREDKLMPNKRNSSQPDSTRVVARQPDQQQMSRSSTERNTEAHIEFQEGSQLLSLSVNADDSLYGEETESDPEEQDEEDSEGQSIAAAECNGPITDDED